MLLGTRNQSTKSNFSTQEFIDKNRMLVESYRNYTCPQVGIDRPFNALEPLGKDPDPLLVTKTAILMENFMEKTVKLTETSRADLPKWVKTGLGLISASHVDDMTDKVISEQPLTNKSGKIHYLDIQTERSKGQLASSTRMFDALRGFIGTQEFSEEKITAEPLGVAGVTDYNVNLEYLPVIPRSVLITDGTQKIWDDGNGNLVGDVAGGGPTNTVNYITGLVDVRFAAATTSTVISSYTYNIEAAVELPKYGISLRSITVEARPRAIATEWSQQSVFDLLADWGIDAEPTILDAGAKIIYAEKFKHVVNHLFRVAAGGTLVFDNITPSGISYQEHIDSFGILLSRTQHEIWQNTQRARPNVIVFSPDIWFLFQYTKGFKGDVAPGQTDSLAGPKVAGTLTNHGITCICDPTFPAGSAVLTYRGNELVNTAAILGTYIPLYKAPIHVQGFRKDTALLTEYVIHVINPEMLGTIQVINL